MGPRLRGPNTPESCGELDPLDPLDRFGAEESPAASPFMALGPAALACPLSPHGQGVIAMPLDPNAISRGGFGPRSIAMAFKARFTLKRHAEKQTRWGLNPSLVSRLSKQPPGSDGKEPAFSNQPDFARRRRIRLDVSQRPPPRSWTSL